MTKTTAPPIYEPLTEQDGKARLPWILFFNKLFVGDTGTNWTPIANSLTVTGTPTITGKIYQLGSSLAYFSILITPATNTSSTAGTTFFSGFPLTMKADGANLAISGLLGSNAGQNDRASNRIYPPSWSAVTVPLTIVGIVEAS